MATSFRPTSSRASSNESPPASPRLTALMGLLTKMYTGCAPSQLPDDDGLMFMAAVWDEQLDTIPTDWLDRVFKAALAVHRTSFALTTGDILTAWDGLLNERMRAAHPDPTRALPAAASVPCPRCHGAGWLIDRQSGKAGQRAAVRCNACQGSGQDAAPHARPTFVVNALLPILRAFTEEHHDPQNAFTLVRWALACQAAGLMPYDLRRMLESAETDSLYEALTALGIAVDPPAPPKPGTVGYWAKVGDSF